MRRVALLSRLGGDVLIDFIHTIRHQDCQIILFATALGYNHSLSDKNYQDLADRVKTMYKDVDDPPPTVIITGISQLIPLIEALDPDMIISFYFPYQLTQPLLNHRSIKINCHPSPLPLFKGSNTFAIAVLQQLPRWAVTWHYINKDYDTGPILVQEFLEMKPPYGILDIVRPVCALVNATFSKAFQMAIEGHPGVPQRQVTTDEEQYLYCKPFTMDERTIKTNSTCQDVCNLVEACKIFNPALLQIEGKLYHVIEARRLDSPSIPSLSTGEIKRKSTRFIHQCADGQVEYIVRSV